MPKKVRIDLVGKVIGKLTVLSYAYSQPTKHETIAFWNCRCECGKTKQVRAKNLLQKKVKSCGCGQGFFIHGRSKKTEYAIWNNMIARCCYPSASHYRYYGGSGIKVCNRWKKFTNFFQDMGLRPSMGHTLDRFPDGAGDYSPTNCRWATKHEQAQNMRGVVLNPQKVLEMRSLIHLSTDELASRFGIHKSTVRAVLTRASWPNV